MESSVANLSVGLVNRAHKAFRGGGYRAWNDLVDQTPDGIDLGQPEHRKIVFQFLNRWGCRLKRSRTPEPSVTEQSMEHWWAESRSRWRQFQAVNLEDLSDSQLDIAADLFFSLRQMPSRERWPIGSTAAAKVFLVLSPDTFAAWDGRIARERYGGNRKRHFRMHLDSCQQWSSMLRQEKSIAKLFDPTKRIGMGKLIDESLYFLARQKH